MKVLLSVISALLRALPWTLQLFFLRSLIRLLFTLLFPFRSVALRNMRHVFPDKDAHFFNKLLARHVQAMARLVADGLRAPFVSREWIEQHVDISNLGIIDQMRAQFEGKGLVVATAHLGSCELLPQVSALLGRPLSFVVRRFDARRVDSWLRELRERNGNTVVNQAGAFQELRGAIESGRNVGILFDHNVGRKHGIFIDFFGRSACTDKALGLSLLRMRTGLVFVWMRYLGQERYKLEIERIEVEDIVGASDLSNEEKLLKVTERATHHLERAIRKYPHEWFWAHRRWGTAPHGEAEDFYLMLHEATGED